MRKSFFRKIEIKHQFFINDKAFILTGKHLAYLTAFLNSPLFKFAFKDDFPELLGDTRELRKVFFEHVTVKEIDDESWYIAQLDKLIVAKATGADTTSIENEITEAIFDIYGLTAVERSMVLGKSILSPVEADSIS